MPKVFFRQVSTGSWLNCVHSNTDGDKLEAYLAGGLVADIAVGFGIPASDIEGVLALDDVDPRGASLQVEPDGKSISVKPQVALRADIEAASTLDELKAATLAYIDESTR